MAVDAQAPSVTRSSAAMVLTVCDIIVWYSVKCSSIYKKISLHYASAWTQDYSNSIVNMLELPQSC